MTAQEQAFPEQRLIHLQHAFEANMQQNTALLTEALKAFLAIAEIQRATLAEMLQLAQLRSVTAHQAADLIGCGYRTVLVMLKDGRLRANDVGTIPVTVIREFQEGKRAKQVVKKGRSRT